MAFKMRGTPVINGTALHKHARSAAVKKAADDQLRQKIAQQNAKGSEMNPADPNSPLPLRGKLQDKINERLNRNVTIGTRMDDEGNEVVTKTVERDRIFGGGRTSRTRDKRNWDIENVAPENRVQQERTVDQSQQSETTAGPIYDVRDPKRDASGGKGNFPIREGDGSVRNPVFKPGLDINPVMPRDPDLKEDPIITLPPKEQEELVEDISNPVVADDTLMQKYSPEVLEALGYIISPVYGLIKEGMGMYEQGPAEYFDRFGGAIGSIGGYIFGEPEEGIQASGSGQAGGGKRFSNDDPMPDENDPKYKHKFNIGEAFPQVITEASDGKVFSTPAGVKEYEQYLADMAAWRQRNPGR